MYWKKILRKYLSFSKRERRGFIALSILLIATLIFNVFVYYYKPPSQFPPPKFVNHHGQNSLSIGDEQEQFKYNFQKFNPNTVSFETLQRFGLNEKASRNLINYRDAGGFFKQPSDINKLYSWTVEEKQMAMSYIEFDLIATKTKSEIDDTASDSIGIEAFDPNKITEDEWIALGISPKVAKTAVNYVKSGGSFNSAEDIAKVYGISSNDVNRLLPYISIHDSVQPIRIQELSEIEIDFTANGEIDINQATLEEITNCGITSTLAWKIINYRDKLGGYYSLQQLNELKGTDSLELYYAFECFRIKPKTLKQIRINQADFTELANHPYLSDRHARAIIRYRDSTGYYRSIDEITRAYRISPQYLGKLKNYLSL